MSATGYNARIGGLEDFRSNVQRTDVQIFGIEPRND